MFSDLSQEVPTSTKLEPFFLFFVLQVIPLGFVPSHYPAIIPERDSSNPSQPFCSQPSYNKTKTTLFELLLFVIPLVQQMNRLVEDLRIINQLKDSPYQYDSEDNMAKAEQNKGGLPVFR